MVIKHIHKFIRNRKNAFPSISRSGVTLKKFKFNYQDFARMHDLRKWYSENTRNYYKKSKAENEINDLHAEMNH